MERKKFTTTLSTDTLKQLNMIKALNNLSGINEVIELLTKEHFERININGGNLNATIKKNK
jgi:hypothetical protein